MRLRPLTRSALPLLLLLGLLVPLPTARADESPAVPTYGAEDMVFKPDELPKGWTVCALDAKLPEGAPSEEALMTLGEAVGLNEDALFVESRAIHKGDQVAVLALIDIDVAPDAFRAVLEESATAGAWVVRDLGSPMRPLVVFAPDAETAGMLADWQRDTAVYHLAEAASKRLTEQSMEGHEAGLALLKAARRVEPKAGVVAAVMGFLQFRQSPEVSLSVWRHALAPGTPVPPRGEMRLEVAFRMGQALLESQNDAVLETARDVLLDAVKREGALDLGDNADLAWMAFGNRYNLACTYARMGKTDEAFAALDGSLALGRKHLSGEQYEGSYRHCRYDDPDMSSLREDDRFKALMAKYDPAGSSDG